MDTERWISQKPYVFSCISFFLQMRNICNASVSRPSGHFRSSRLMRRPVWGSDLETTRFVTLPAALFYPFTEIHNGAREKQFVRICICERYRAQSCVICDNLFFSGVLHHMTTLLAGHLGLCAHVASVAGRLRLVRLQRDINLENGDRICQGWPEKEISQTHFWAQMER